MMSRRQMDCGMFWIRANRRIGAAVALFALAVQLVLSFGHVHLDKAGPFGPAVAGISAPQASNGGGAPPDRHHRPGADDFCAICATISLASTLLLPEPAAITLPIAHAQTWPPQFQATLATREPQYLFQARAPPGVSLLG
jgi:hypothetical protein